MINRGFLRRNRPTKTTGKPPNPNSNKGVLISSDFDIGLRSPEEIRHILHDENDPELSMFPVTLDLPIGPLNPLVPTNALATKLIPYTKLRGQKAIDFLADNPLTISDDDSEIISVWHDGYLTHIMTNSWNYGGAKIRFSDLEDEQQTSLVSWLITHDDLPSKVPDIWAKAITGDWTGVAEVLRTDPIEPLVRNEEADMLDGGFGAIPGL